MRSRSLRTLALVALLAGLALGRAPVAHAAQDDDDSGLIDETSYESPGFGYEIEWTDDWEANEDGTQSSDDGDFLLLTRSRSTIVTVLGGEFPEDLEDLLEDVVSVREDAEGIEDVETLGTNDGDGYAATTIAFDLNGQPFNEYLEARQYDEDVVVVVTYLGLVDTFDGGLGSVGEEVSFDGDPLFLGAEDGIPEGGQGGDDGEDGEDEDEETPESDDEETPEAEDEDDEETPEAEAEDGFEGVEGTTYTSPNFGFVLTWDEDEWEVRSTASEEDRDRVRLSNGTSIVQVYGDASFGGDAEACRDGWAEDLGDDEGVEDFAPLEEVDGEPGEGETDDGAFYGAYGLAYTPEDGEPAERVNYVECRVLVEGESNLVILQGTTAADFEAEIAAREDLLEGLELPEAEDGEDEEADEEADEDEETPEADEEADEDADEEDADEEENEDAEEDDTV